MIKLCFYCITENQSSLCGAELRQVFPRRYDWRSCLRLVFGEKPRGCRQSTDLIVSRDLPTKSEGTGKSQLVTFTKFIRYSKLQKKNNIFFRFSHKEEASFLYRSVGSQQLIVSPLSF